jgi:hypothetical protein
MTAQGMRVTNEALPAASDGTPYITDEMIAENPALGEMVKRQANSWAYDDARRVWFGPTPTYAPAVRRTDYGRKPA